MIKYLLLMPILFSGHLPVNQDIIYYGSNLKDFEKELKFIPAKTIEFGKVLDQQQDFPEHHFTDLYGNKKIEVDSFYMFSMEVSNGFYQDFVGDMREKDAKTYQKYLPDTSLWNATIKPFETYSENYYSQQVFHDYPVVGVTLEQANAFCEWLTNKYNTSENRKYKKVKFKIPSLVQWVSAASGNELQSSRFPWSEHNDLIDGEGYYLANFRVVDQSWVYVDTIKEMINGSMVEHVVLRSGTDGYISHWSDRIRGRDYDQIRTPDEPLLSVRQFGPYNHGLYNMAGNVSEMVSEFGFVKGGSCFSTGYYLQNTAHQRYSAKNPAAVDRGFRFMMEIIER